ncbi:MAG: cell surface protein SprA, partial [Gemmatimonadota bacterium]
TSGCRGGIKPPQLENRINARSSGVIGQRVHVNVDYDSERDFGANNNIQVYYQGLEDEVVRRVEVGTVTFRPPPSRFLTAAIPSNNFGVNATFEVGALQFQALAATQKGSALAHRTYTMGGSQSSQPQDRQVRDLDYESGRFFWVIDPRLFPSYPRVDILNLDVAQVPAARRPVQVRVYQYRAGLVRNGIDPNLAGLGAFARNHDNPADTTQVIGGRTPDEGARWRLLIQGTDYYLDRAGTWFTLASKLDPSDYLAVSYTTAGGTTFGTFPSQDNPQAVDSLELITRPNQDPNSATFLHEMRQIYRIAGSDLELPSLRVTVSLNRSERPSGGASTYLSLFGLSVPTDANVFDAENRLFPRARDPAATQTVKEAYVIFPSLQPFSDTPGLAPGERSDSLYRTPQYLLLSQGPPSRFQIRLQYNASSGGDRSTLVLNAAQIREGSEELTIGGRTLERGSDYSIDYATGRVTFLNPSALFGSGSAQVSAKFEQQDAFAIAPTSILGFTSRYALGDVGAINFVGLMQREATAFNRPQLGFEARANLLAGVNTELHFKPLWVTRALNSITSKSSTAPSLFDVNAEVAFSRPDPNRSGAAYLESFEGDASTPVTMNELLWGVGSRPQRTDGLEAILGASFDLADAVQLTWQNAVPDASGKLVTIRPQDIDSFFKFAGSGDQFETTMFMTLHADTAGGLVQNNNHSRWSQPERPNRPRWRSMVTALSTTGLDLSKSEFLEFWVYQPENHSADSAGTQLVFDLGSVDEDAVALAPLARTASGSDTTYSGRQYVGLGRLDTERSRTGIFNAELDDNGILGDRPDSLITNEDLVERFPALCVAQLSSVLSVFPWGDLSSRCTNGNGHADTEDLDGDLQLNATGGNDNVYRYIVPLASNQFKVPDRGRRVVGQSGREAGWTLYRVPLRTANAIAIGTPNIRLVKQLRVTVVGANDGGRPDVVGRFAFARMRFVGAPWVRRTETPVAGFDGALGSGVGEVVVSIVSTENKLDLGYTSPPGVVNATARRDVGQEALGQQINEKSLRIIGRGLTLGERAEGYLRFPAGSQNLLNYNELRVWARGRGAGWESGDVEAFIKVGSDPDNFYLYHAPARTTDWEPELVVDLSVWRRLRAEVEGRWLRGDAPSGAAACGSTNPQAYVACEGGYVVNVGNPGVNPPNLAAIQEVAAGIYRAADHGALPEAELWIDDIRLASPVSSTGRAIALDGRLIAADVGDVALSYISRSGQFRQLAETPTYQSTNTMALNTNWRLDRFLPPSLGLAIPATVTYARSSVDPQLLSGTDLRGQDLAGLRRPEGWSATYSVQIRRTTRGRSWLSKGFLDPLSLAGSVTRGHSVTELNNVDGSNSSYRADYNLVLQRTGPRLPTGGLIGHLPAWLQKSEIGKALRNPRISLAPTSLRLASGLTHDEALSIAYLVPVRRVIDTLLTPTISLSQLWRNSGGLTWQPLGMLTMSADLASTRDLRNYSDSTPIGRLAGVSRRSFLGLDAGVERDRNLTTQAALVPRLSTWLQPRYIASSGFVLSRTFTSRPPVRLGEDSAGAFILPQTLNNSQARELGASVDLVRLGRLILGDSSRVVSRLARIRPLDLSSRTTRTSTYDLAAFEPTLRYQFAIGGLDNFLSQKGTGAIGASDVHTNTLSSGADLPFGVNFTLQYSLTDASYYQAVGTGLLRTQTVQKEWPVGTARWNRTFRGGPIALFELGATFRQRSGTSTQPAVDEGVAATSLIRSSNFTPDARIGLRNGMQFSARLSSLTQNQVDNGTDRRSDQGDMTGTFNYTLRLPRSLSRSRKAMQSSLAYTRRTALTCLQRLGEVECLPISDVRSQEVRGSLRTDVLKTLTGSVDLGYKVDDARHLDRKTGNLYLLVSLSLSLFAGDYR